LKLAEQLGGSTVVLTGDDVVASVMAYARRNNVTQIVIGKSRDSRLRELLGRTLATALLRQARGAAVHVVTERGEDDGGAPLAESLGFSLAGWRGHVGALGAVGVTGVVANLLDRFWSGADLAMIFLLSVLGAGLAFGLWPAVTAAAAAALVYNFFFLEPRLSFAIGHATDVLTFIVFFVVAMTTGWLTGRIRDQSRRTSARASAIAALLASSRRLSGSATRADTAHALADQISAAGNAKAIVLLPKGEEIEAVAGAPTLEVLGAAAMAAARWAWEKGEAAGHGTGTLPQTSWTFWPLQGVRERVGVAGVEADALRPGSDEEKLVLALLDQGAVALERADLALAAVEAETLRRSDRFRAALLNSISHDLRTPLSTVLGSTTTMIEYGEGMPAATRADLLQSVREEAERLNRYVGNLLDMTRLEGGGLNIREDWIDVRDVLAAAAERVERRLGKRHVERDFPPDLPPVRLDPNLLEQAVVNILENAIAYSPDETAIDLAAYEDRNNVVISIEDEGKGIPTAELERVFEKFRRMEEPTDRTKGAGLGLSISKGFIEAMGGRIAAASPIHGDHGTRVLISLPKSPQRTDVTP
jgi:two-component system sensor histidine kinase KdpD